VIAVDGTTVREADHASNYLATDPLRDYAMAGPCTSLCRSFMHRMVNAVMARLGSTIRSGTRNCPSFASGSTLKRAGMTAPTDASIRAKLRRPGSSTACIGDQSYREANSYGSGAAESLTLITETEFG
jgi:hypothetical protein